MAGPDWSPGEAELCRCCDMKVTVRPDPPAVVSTAYSIRPRQLIVATRRGCSTMTDVTRHCRTGISTTAYGSRYAQRRIGDVANTKREPPMYRRSISPNSPTMTSRAASTPAYFLGRPADVWLSALRRRTPRAFKERT